MKIYFRKLGARNCYIVNYALTGDLLYTLNKEHFPMLADSTEIFAKIEKILKDTFVSVDIVQKMGPGAYFDFVFRDREDEAYFLMWSSDGIEI